MTYTPTTEEIRELYSDSYYLESGFNGEENFDAWLAEYTRQQREEAWNEGEQSGWNSGNYRSLPDENPYHPKVES